MNSYFTSVNPTTGETIESYPCTPDSAIDSTLDIAQRAFAHWRRSPMSIRSAALNRVADLLDERADRLSKLIADEMGKPISQGAAEAKKCAQVCRHYAQRSESLLADSLVQTQYSKSYVRHDPLGVVFAIMPWNFPLWQVFRYFAPSTMAGNTTVLKHAPSTTGCAYAIKELIDDAGFPQGTLSVVVVDTDAAAQIIEDPRIQAVTLTGSEAAGRSVAATAGRALKKAVLELGGSDPYIILSDADVPRAAEICATSKLINAGQSCVAAKRFIVVPDVITEFKHHFLRTLANAIVGDPLDPRTTVGPLARRDLRDTLHQQVQASRSAANVILGGAVPEGNGAFYPVTVLDDVRPGVPAYSDELFGPVAAILRAGSETDALRLANDTRFGLGAAVFTSDPERGERLATLNLEAGATFVNGHVVSDPRLPFGGVRASGYGRELGDIGLLEFVNHRTVVVA